MPALQALFDAGHSIAAAYTQPDRPAGRGRKLAASPVKRRARLLGIPIEQPPSLRDAEAARRLSGYAPQAMIVAAYGLILPPAILRAPPLGCINIHASLLPRWRGAAPIQRAILAGDAASGVSIMQMEEGLDTGPVYARIATEISRNETAGSLHDRLATMGADAIVRVLAALARNEAHAQPQDAAEATYARKIDKAEALLDWTRSADELERKVRAFNPWPVAETRWHGSQLRIWAAHTVSHDGPSVPGSVLRATSDGIFVACAGGGALCLDTVQIPGGRPMDAAAFLNSHDLRDAVLG